MYTLAQRCVFSIKYRHGCFFRMFENVGKIEKQNVRTSERGQQNEARHKKYSIIEDDFSTT